MMNESFSNERKKFFKLEGTTTTTTGTASHPSIMRGVMNFPHGV